MKYLIIAVLLIPFVSANVVIHQVLYDPVATESGGEAIELKNTGSSAVDISGWVVQTETSSADATVPVNTVLEPGKTFLIADEGWDDKKDDLDWRSADYEEKITLNNKDSYVALLNGSKTVDVVGWGDAEYYDGSPVAMVSSGSSLLRVNDSGDNSEDFSERVADFFDGIAVPVTADVSIYLPVIEVSSSLNLAPEGVLRIKNNGKADVDVKLIFNDLHFLDHVISKESIFAESEFSVAAGDEEEVNVKLSIPVNTPPGKYTSTLRVLIQ